jgi:hypothetical protein
LRLDLEENAMYGRAVTHPGMRAATVLCLLLLSACSHWPWRHPPPPPPTGVHELDISGTTLANAPQFWKRNTLLVDLTAASGSGSIVLRHAADRTWPVRLALRVTPGSVGLLQVRGDELLSLPITAGAPKPVDLELAPGVYGPRTAQITVTWGPAPVVPVLPEPTPRR